MRTEKKAFGSTLDQYTKIKRQIHDSKQIIIDRTEDLQHVEEADVV